MEIMVDARELEPPLPFEQTMAALDQMQQGDEVVLWLYRRPEPLFNVLRRNGYTWSEAIGPEGCFEYRIRSSK